MNNNRFCIVQLTRMGDLIQTYQAASQFKEVYPAIGLTLVARSEMVTPIEFLLKKAFDQIIKIDRKQLLKNSNNSISGLIDQSKELLKSINDSMPTVTINLSYCQTSNYLTTLINCQHKLGTRISAQNQVVVNDQWSQLVYSTVMNGPYCPYNLVDIYKFILGLKESGLPKFQKKRESNQESILAIHPFASHSKKMWKAHKWSEVIYKLLKENENLKIEIFGSKNEEDSARDILETTVLSKYKTRISNYVGKLNIEEVYNRFDKCTHFTGHDSLLGHLAKVQGLPTLTISLGTVRPVETTPYGEKSYALVPRQKCFPCFPETECNFYQCHADLSYQATVSVLNSFLNDDEINYEKISDSITSFHLSSFDLYKFGESNKGLFVGEKIGSDYPIYREIVKDFYRVAISYKFEEIEENFSFPVLSQESAQKLAHTSQGVQQLFELSEFGKKYSGYILKEISNKDPDLIKIKNFGKRIDEVDRLQELIKKTYPELSPIIDFYKVVRFNLHGVNIVELSESSYVVYNDCSIVCSIVFELINKSLNNFDKLNGKKASTKEGSA